jgi:hypothetical protein
MQSQDLDTKGLSEPPDYIDGAKVLKWAWSGAQPFGFVSNMDGTEREDVYGLAICQYEQSGSLYRFSCGKSWDTIQDSLYDTVELAISGLPQQYKNIEAVWHTK